VPWRCETSTARARARHGALRLRQTCRNDRFLTFIACCCSDPFPPLIFCFNVYFICDSNRSISCCSLFFHPCFILILFRFYRFRVLLPRNAESVFFSVFNAPDPNSGFGAKSWKIVRLPSRDSLAQNVRCIPSKAVSRPIFLKLFHELMS